MHKINIINLTNKIKNLTITELEQLLQASFRYFKIRKTSVQLKEIAKNSQNVREFASSVITKTKSDSTAEFQILLLLLEGYWLHIPKKHLNNRSEFELEKEHFTYSPVGRFIIELKNDFIIDYFKNSFPIALTPSEFEKIKNIIEKKWLKKPNKSLGNAIPNEILKKDLEGKVKMEPHLDGFKFFVTDGKGKKSDITPKKHPQNKDKQIKKTNPTNKINQIINNKKNIIEKNFLITPNSKFKNNVTENLEILNKVFDNIQDQGIETQLNAIQLWLKYTNHKEIKKWKTNLYAAALEFSIRQKKEKNLPNNEIMIKISKKYKENPNEIAQLSNDILNINN